MSIAAAILFSTRMFQNVQKQVKVSSPALNTVSLNQHETALAEKQGIMLDHKLLNVPLIAQMSAPKLYNGCEVTSLAMILNYNGYLVTKNELAEKIKTVPLTYSNGLKGNPNMGFVGDIDDGPGYAAYNGPIYDLAKQYAGDKVVNLTSSTFIDLLKTVSNGQPVWVITTSSFAPVSDFVKWQTPQGSVDVTFSEHSVVITGYDSNYIYINDPYGFKNRKINRANFERAWEQLGSQGIFIKKTRRLASP
ncbi:C39 family peptidase [Neobacillus sp. PS3-12]|jgi:uncharacterized protein YvpB|uniref:C39 family peptidase n=1 Tax=Neobacillus sp. PS3-12 TaxID=3070677 RepID=UPI0035A8D864